MWSNKFANVFMRFLPELIFVLGMLFTYLFWGAQTNLGEQHLYNHFVSHAQTVSERIEHRLRAHEQLLRGVRAVFANNPQPDMAHFQAHLRSLKSNTLFPEIQGIGFVPIQLQSSPEHLYIEPLNSQNLSRLATLRAALVDEHDENRVTLIKKQEGDNILMIMSLPVYRAAMNQEDMLGWVVSVIHLPQLANRQLDEVTKQLDIKIFDQTQDKHSQTLYDNKQNDDVTAAFTHRHDFSIGAHHWSVQIRTAQGFSVRTIQHIWILLTGFVLCGVLSWLCYVLQRSRDHHVDALHALEISQVRLQATFDNSPFMIWQKDRDGCYTIFNYQFLKITGKRDATDVLGKTDFDIWSIERAEQYRMDDAMIMATRKSKIMEEELSVGGKRIILETCKTPILDHNGMVVGTTGFARDITERKQAETEYRTIIQTTPDGFWLVDIYTNSLVDVNPAYCEMSGYTRDELMTMFMPDIESEYDEKLHQQYIAQIRQETPIFYESKHRRKDGSIFTVEVSSRLLPLHGGLIVAFIRDITARKYAELLLRENQERLAVATTAGIIGVWDWNIVSGHLTWDEVMYRLYGTHSAEFEQNFDAWLARIEPEDRGGVQAAIQAAIAGESEFAAEFRITWEDGSVHYMKAASRTQCDAQGKALRMIGITYDISEQKRVTLAIERARLAAESANRAKTEFLANMSHEIRTPMNAIIGLSDLALGSGELSPKLHNYLDKIYGSSRALLSLINDILDYSKIEADRLALEHGELNLEDLLETISGLFNVRAHEKGIELILDVDTNIPPYLSGDHLRLEQVLSNLVGNAIKFTEKGEILISVEQLALKDEQTTLRFSIRDTGIGISEEMQSRLFTAFTQADSSMTRRFGGTGLGLIISQKIIEKMGGEIQVNSQLGQGSTFSFILTLPVVSLSDPFVLPSTLQNAPILVVDPSLAARQSLCNILCAWGAQVVESDAGEDALRQLQQQHCALVLINETVSDMTGLDLAQKIYSSDVVILSVHSKAELVQQITGTHIRGILNKPILPSKLFEALGALDQSAHTLPTQLSITHKSHINVDTSPIFSAKVLLVEDFETNQLVAKDILERMGLQVKICNNGQEALDILEEVTFDAVLMDLHMPVMDGFTATQRIRENPAWQKLPIIAMTAASMHDDRNQCIAAGMNDHVAKPILPHQLAEILLQWIKPTGLQAPQREVSVTQTVLPEHMQGFDIAEALHRLGGNGALLINLWQKFAAQFEQTEAEFNRHFNHGDRAGCLAIVHRTKGAAANLGAIQLRDAAKALEEALRSEQSSINPDHFLQVLHTTLATLSQVAPDHSLDVPATDEDCQRCNWQHATQIMIQLRPMVENYDYIGLETFTELNHAIPCAPCRKKINEFEAALDLADREKAMQILDNFPCIRGHKFDGDFE